MCTPAHTQEYFLKVRLNLKPRSWWDSSFWPRTSWLAVTHTYIFPTETFSTYNHWRTRGKEAQSSASTLKSTTRAIKSGLTRGRRLGARWRWRWRFQAGAEPLNSIRWIDERRVNIHGKGTKNYCFFASFLASESPSPEEVPDYLLWVPHTSNFIVCTCKQPSAFRGNEIEGVTPLAGNTEPSTAQSSNRPMSRTLRPTMLNTAFCMPELGLQARGSQSWAQRSRDFSEELQNTR